MVESEEPFVQQVRDGVAVGSRDEMPLEDRWEFIRRIVYFYKNPPATEAA